MRMKSFVAVFLTLTMVFSVPGGVFAAVPQDAEPAAEATVEKEVQTEQVPDAQTYVENKDEQKADDEQMADENQKSEGSPAKDSSEEKETKDKEKEIKDKEAKDAKNAEAEKASLEKKTLDVNRDNYEITVSGMMPGDAELDVKEIGSSTDEYKDYIKDASKEVFKDSEEKKGDTLPYARFFDIKIKYADGKEEFQPDSDLTLKIDTKDGSLKRNDVDFSAIHFNEQKGNKDGYYTEIAPMAIKDKGEGDKKVASIEADSFSVYGVTFSYTVDYYYGDAEYHQNGGSQMMMSELFAKLGIEKRTADITKVEFTDESLVSFTKEGSDYNIKSLNPFTSSEKLTITFADGEVIEIGVEDATPRDRTPGTDNSINWNLAADGTLTIRATKDATSAGFSTNRTSQAGWNTFWATGPNATTTIRNEVTKVVFTTPASGVKINLNDKAIAYMFSGFTNLESIDFGKAITGTATNLEGFFYGCENLKEIKNLGTLDTSKVTKMKSMFQGCSSIKELDLSGFSNSGNVQEMQDMFRDCSILEKIVLGSSAKEFKARPVTGPIEGGCQMQRMFYGCSSLKHLEMINCEFSGGRSGWADISDAFRAETGGEDSKLYKNALETLILKDCRFPGVTDWHEAFADCPSLTRVDISSGVFTDAVYMNEMFNNSFSNPRGQSDDTTPILDVSGFGKLSSIETMQDFVAGNGSKLKTIILDNLDNSNIKENTDNGAARVLGIDKLKELQTLSAKKSKVWMVKAETKSTGSNHYWSASGEGAEGNIPYIMDNKMYFEPDVGTSPDKVPGGKVLLNKREWIDLVTDRFEKTYGSTATPDKGTNVNVAANIGGTSPGGTDIYGNSTAGHTNYNGAGFLAPGVYTKMDDTKQYFNDLPITLYRVNNMDGSINGGVMSKPTVKIDGQTVYENGTKSFDTYTGGMYKLTDATGGGLKIETPLWGRVSWNANKTVTVPIEIIYPDAASDVYGNTKDVKITINSITFTDIDKIPHVENYVFRDPADGSDPDPNIGHVAGDTYKRWLFNIKPGDLQFLDYVRMPDDSYALSSGSGSEVNFDIEVLDAEPNSSVLFYLDDLDVPSNQNWISAEKAKDDVLPWNKTVGSDEYGPVYGPGSEGIRLGNGNDLSSITLANHTGLEIVDGNYVIPTGMDQTTPWSAVYVRADASGANYTWTNGIGCTTYLLKNTDPFPEINPVYIMPEVLKSVSGSVPTGLYFSDYFRFDMEDVSSNIQNVSIDEYSGLQNQAGPTPSLGTSRTNEGEYIYFGHLKFDSPDRAGEKKAYIYRIKEQDGVLTDDVIRYDTATKYYLQIIIIAPGTDEELREGTKAIVYCGEQRGDGNIFWDEDNPITIVANNMQPVYKTKRLADGKDYDLYIDSTGTEYYEKDGIKYKAEDDSPYTPVGNTQQAQKTVTKTIEYPVYETAEGVKFYRKDNKCLKLDGTVIDPAPRMNTVKTTEETKDITESFYVYKDANGKEFFRQGGKFWTAEDNSTTELNRTTATEGTTDKKVSFEGKEYYVYSDHNGVQYFKADNGKYYTPMGKELISAREGDIDPKPNDEFVMVQKKVRDEPVRKDVHGVEYFKKNGKYYDANNPSEELTVGSGKDGDFNPNDATDLYVYEKKTAVIDGSTYEVRKDAYGEEYCIVGSSYKDPVDGKSLTTKSEGNVDPNPQTDARVKDRLVVDVPLRESRTGNGYIIYKTSDNPSILYYKDNNNKYYTVIGTTIVPSVNFNPSNTDQPITTRVEIMTDVSNNNQQFYRIENQYYEYPGGLPYKLGTDAVDTSDIPDVGTFHNVIKTSEISVKKQAEGNKKSGAFTYRIKFDTDFEPSNIVYEPAQGNAKPVKVDDWSKENNVWKFTLYDGQKMTIRNVPFQTTYTITEDLSETGWEFVSATNWNSAQEKQVEGSENKATGKVAVEKYLVGPSDETKVIENPEYKGQYDHEFTNRLTEVLLSKVVRKGNKQDKFKFTAEVTVPDTAVQTGYSYGWMDGADNQKYYTEKAGGTDPVKKVVTINDIPELADGDDVSIVVPKGSTVKVTEDSGEYEASYVADGAAETDGKAATVTADADKKKITFYNEKNEVKIIKKWNDNSNAKNFRPGDLNGFIRYKVGTNETELTTSQYKEEHTGAAWVKDGNTWTFTLIIPKAADLVGGGEKAVPPGYTHDTSADVLDTAAGTFTLTNKLKETEESVTLKRTITYKYEDDNTPVLDDKGDPITEEQEITFNREVTGWKDDGTPVWGAWEPAENIMPAVDSPKADRSDYTPKEGTVPATGPLTAEDKDYKDTKYPDVTVLYEKAPKAGEKKTYGGKGETQKGTPPFEEGSKPIKDFILIDPETGNPVDKVNVPGKGTYTVDTKTGEVTFVPDKEFVGSATTVTVRGIDENGNYADGKYTPVVVDNTETIDKTQKITYVYDSGNPVLDDKGNPLVKERKATFTRTGKVDPETGSITWDNWTETTLPKEDSPEITGFTPDKTSVAATKATPDNWPNDETVTYKALPNPKGPSWIEGSTVKTIDRVGRIQYGTLTFKPGATPIAYVVFIDPATGEETDAKSVDVYGKNGKKIGTYSLNSTGKKRADGSIAYEIKFTPVDSYTGKPPAITLRAYDKSMLYADGVYQPNVIGGKDEKEKKTDDKTDKKKLSPKSATKTTVKAARTGDEVPLTLWLLLMSVSGAAVIAGIFRRRKKH